MMVLGAVVYALRTQPDLRRRWSFGAAMAVLAVVFISPLCALTVALFSARVVHHVLLVAIAAPLLAWALMRLGRAGVLARLLMPLVLLHTAIFWLWHAPDAYLLALTSTPVYWLMQVTLLGSAVLLWMAVFAAAPARGIMALLAIVIQMGLLGALLVFSSSPLYVPHFTTTLPFGFEPLTDQQLSGLIMWVPASLPYLVVALLRLMALLREPGVRSA